MKEQLEPTPLPDVPVVQCTHCFEFYFLSEGCCDQEVRDTEKLVKEYDHG